MKCQILFSRKNKKNIVSLLSDEFVHSIVTVNNKEMLTSKKVVLITKTRLFK